LSLPEKVTLLEVGPRDGFQFEKKTVPTTLKIEIITGLIEAGLSQIQVTAFVHPRRVPQMADADKLVKRLPQKEGVEFWALVLNRRGVERALDAGMRCIEISISASDTHSQKNTGMTFDQGFQEAAQMVRSAHKAGFKIRAGVQCAFGCADEGAVPPERVLKMVLQYLSLGVDQICIADTTGMATPWTVKKLLGKLLPETGHTPVGLHLHDTRGLGLVNTMAAMEYGITCFDTSMAGMGGCPFIPGAAGNIATEDTTWLMRSLGIQTGIHMERIAALSFRLETFFQKCFAGKMHRVIIGGNQLVKRWD